MINNAELKKCATLRNRRKIRKKLHKALASPGDWERHNSALKKLAAPKRVHEQPQPPKPTKKKKYSLKRLNVLAQPINLHPIMMPDPFSVKQSALTYRITKHMKHLAKMKDIPQPIFNVPGRVNPMALLIEASTRIINLAKSVVRPLGLETDLKKNAFSVSPSALKAICSPRLKVLAKPKKRPPHKR
ncbi:PREDICTED: uncharacterized protein LOC105359444 [Ceratosolen solmsi marchali]|uniref:Uncharacterized protein LOC105359444 n=1 Tax=Ceratosolen solmsi marchali TaxID=326594 RepID=A0AAJ6VLC6_9HYME|nr:PREDICTED: uncharacterized protein LOC105359444 [Ceratosolen solmsi marchali]